VKAALFAVSTVQEEIGLRGAQTSTFSIDPQIGIAVDVTHATDCPTIDKRQQGEIALSSGPVIDRGPNINPRLFDRLIETATAAEIPYQLAAQGRATPTDANAIQISRSGVAAGLISIPNRYMHSAVKTIALDDIDRAADLLAAFVSGLSGDEDFTPWGTSLGVLPLSSRWARSRTSPGLREVRLLLLAAIRRCRGKL
jgi:tetrahedral aminopeptidase